MERRERKDSSGGGGLGALFGMAVGALAVGGIAYLVNKFSEECKSEDSSYN